MNHISNRSESSYIGICTLIREMIQMWSTKCLGLTSVRCLEVDKGKFMEEKRNEEKWRKDSERDVQEMYKE